MKKALSKKNIIVLLALALPLNVMAAAPVYNLQLTYGQEDFGSNGDDRFKKLTASVRSVLGLSRYSAFNLNADLSTRFFDSLSSNDSTNLLLEAIYNFVPKSGFSKPTYFIGLRQERETFDEKRRNIDQTSLFLGAAIRLNDRLTLTPGVEIIKKTSDIEDSDISGAFINADIRMTDQWLFYFNYKYQSEDITSKLAMSNRLANKHHTSNETGTITSVPTNTAFGANYSIDSHQTIDVSYQRQNYSITGSPDVTGDVISLDYFYKF